MHVEIHDKGELVCADDLTFTGKQEAIYHCERLIEELRAALDEESEDDEEGD